MSSNELEITNIKSIQDGFPQVCPLPNRPVNKLAKNIARENDLFKDVCQTIQPQKILEVGSWMGASAISWRKESSIYKKTSKVYCIDTWLGSPEHHLRIRGKGEWVRENLSINDRGPQFFEDFLANIHGAGYENYILPMRADSQSALSYLNKIGALFDVIYIDGGHDEISVFRDITRAVQIIRDEGVICGDDYLWKTVRTGLLLAKLDKSTPRMYILHKGNDYIVLPKSNKKLINQFKLRGYSRFKSWNQFLSLVKFASKKLIQALIKNLDISDQGWQIR